MNKEECIEDRIFFLARERTIHIFESIEKSLKAYNSAYSKEKEKIKILHKLNLLTCSFEEDKINQYLDLVYKAKDLDELKRVSLENINLLYGGPKVYLH